MIVPTNILDVLLRNKVKHGLSWFLSEGTSYRRDGTNLVLQHFSSSTNTECIENTEAKTIDTDSSVSV